MQQYIKDFVTDINTYNVQIHQRVVHILYFTNERVYENYIDNIF
jgi:hypothetical protein